MCFDFVDMGKVQKQAKQAPKKPLTRKEQRKLKQETKKNNKRIFHASKINGAQRVAEAAAAAAALAATKGKGKKKKKPKKAKVNPEDIPREQLLAGEVDADDDESIASDFSDAEVDARLPASRKVETFVPLGQRAPKKHVGIQREDEVVARKRELRQQKEILTKSRKQRMKQLKLENEEEDKEIAKLEKKLKLNKSKDKNRVVRKMFNDGLDYLLDFVLDDDEEKLKWEEKQRRKKELKEQREKEEAGMWSEEDDEQMDDMSEADSEMDEDEVGSDESAAESDDDMDDEGDEEEQEAEPKCKAIATKLLTTD